VFALWRTGDLDAQAAIRTLQADLRQLDGAQRELAAQRARIHEQLRQIVAQLTREP
jgi:prefoldin subunit 5